MNDRFKDDKLIRLSLLAEQTGMSIHCIRNYVDQGLIPINDRTAGGLLLFSPAVTERLDFIKTARDAGVPLTKIVSLLTTCDQGDDEGINTSLAELR